MLVSGRKRIVITAATAVIIPAIINGNDGEIPTVRAEIAGPKTNPNPKDAPIMPNPFARSAGVVVSEITAEATDIFPAVRPSNPRARKRKNALGAKACIKNDMTVPIMEIIRSGLLPYLSDKRPMNGVARKEQIEKIEKRSPFWKSERPKCLEYEYRIGITIPYPKAFTTAMSAMMRRFLSLNIRFSIAEMDSPPLYENPF